jgi:hypothetical protein
MYGHGYIACSSFSIRAVCARLLGYMLLHVPTAVAIICWRKLPSVIIILWDCQTEYIDHFVRCCECVLEFILSRYSSVYMRTLSRSVKGPTSSQSNHPSQPSFDNVQDTVRNALMECHPGKKLPVAPLCLLHTTVYTSCVMVISAVSS